MAAEALIYAGAMIVSLWGGAHLIPTGSVVIGFGSISLDNRRVLTMEWAAEGLTMLFVGALLMAVTLSADAGDSVAVLVYRMAAGLLCGIAILTAFMAARTPVGWFKACPLCSGPHARRRRSQPASPASAVTPERHQAPSPP